MKPDCLNIINSIIDIIARIIVPLLVVVIGGIQAKRIAVEIRFENFKKLAKDCAKEQDSTDDEQAFLEKTLNEVYSKPRMTWYR